MKKKLTNKLVFKNNNVKIITEEDIGSVAVGAFKGVSDDVAKTYSAIGTAAKKIGDITINYPIDLFIAWYNGDSLRAVHKEHADRQRELSREIKDKINSMSGAKDLNAFLAFAAPNIAVVDIVINNATYIDKKLEKKSDTFRKRFNSTTTEIYRKLGLEKPEWLRLDDGTSKKDLTRKRVELYNNILEIFKMIKNTEALDKKSKYNVDDFDNESDTKVLNSEYAEIRKVLAKLSRDFKNEIRQLITTEYADTKEGEVFLRIIKNEDTFSQLFSVFFTNKTLESVESLRNSLLSEFGKENRKSVYNDVFRVVSESILRFKNNMLILSEANDDQDNAEESSPEETETPLDIIKNGIKSEYYKMHAIDYVIYLSIKAFLLKAHIAYLREINKAIQQMSELARDDFAEGDGRQLVATAGLNKDAVENGLFSGIEDSQKIISENIRKLINNKLYTIPDGITKSSDNFKKSTQKHFEQVIEIKNNYKEEAKKLYGALTTEIEKAQKSSKDENICKLNILSAASEFMKNVLKIDASEMISDITNISKSEQENFTTQEKYYKFLKKMDQEEYNKLENVFKSEKEAIKTITEGAGDATFKSKAESVYKELDIAFKKLMTDVKEKSEKSDTTQNQTGKSQPNSNSPTPPSQGSLPKGPPPPTAYRYQNK